MKSPLIRVLTLTDPIAFVFIFTVVFILHYYKDEDVSGDNDIADDGCYDDKQCGEHCDDDNGD